MATTDNKATAWRTATIALSVMVLSFIAGMNYNRDTTTKLRRQVQTEMVASIRPDGTVPVTTTTSDPKAKR